MTPKEKFLLFIIFMTALFLRFLYFPTDIYFGYDQARDAFAVGEILSGHLKAVGPTTSFEGLRHGVFHYYLYTPFYFISKGDPEIVAAFIRVVNSFGVFLIFIISRVLFNKYVGLISALLFAVSFEQTQFAMYFSNPTFDVISILVMYLGLALLIFRKKDLSLIIAFIGLGLSIQFQLFTTYLFVPFILILLIFRKSIPHLRAKVLFLAIVAFLFTVSTFIISEIKYSFRSINFLSSLLTNNASQKSLYRITSTYLFEMGQVIKFNLTGLSELRVITALISFLTFLILLSSKVKKQIFFLSIWFFSTIIIYFITGGESLSVDIIQYHPNVGASIPLIIFVSYLIYILGKKTHFLIALLLVGLIFAGNFSLIQKNNLSGSIPEFMAQSFMLLSDEKKVLDFIYSDADKEQFAVKAITLPFYVNTTWSYLFQWYGKEKYGYVPIWGGKNADGYPGDLQVVDAQDKLPNKRYLIIEPLRGIPINLVQDYLREEGYFTDIIKEENIGHFKIQVRVKKS